MRFSLKNIPVDRFSAALLATVLLAAFWPARGAAAPWVDRAGLAAVALLFFLHGVKLSPQNLWAGLSHWRLQLLIVVSTFVIFPILGLALKPLAPLVGPSLYAGFLFLCALPSTVQSSIAFTSIARGNVAASVCAASSSSLLGVFLTPLLVSLLLGAEASLSLDTLKSLALQLILPFGLGQASRRWLAPWVERRRALVSYVDRGSILLIVYRAFSEGQVMGVWRDVSVGDVLGLIFLSGLLLTLIMLFTSRVARRLGFNRADRLSILFCGSKKSLATGVPMANVIFSPAAAGTMLAPVMIFHQIQLMVCSLIASRAAKSQDQ